MAEFWTVAQTESQRESVAAKFLRKDHYETYLPCIALRRQRIAPLFPAYIFVKIIDRWWSIKWTVGVLRVLSWDDRPARVADDVVEKIRAREGRDGLIRLPRARGLQRGDAVRIVRGSMSGQLGLYDGMSGADRSRVLLGMLGRSVPVSIQTSDIVPIETRSTG